MKNHLPAASLAMPESWSRVIRWSIPSPFFSARVLGLPLGVASAACLASFLPLGDASSVRLWACLGGVSALLHVPRALAARSLGVGSLLVLAAGLQFALAMRGASHPGIALGSAYALGAGLTVSGPWRGRDERAVLLGWGWSAFQVAAAAFAVA